MKILVAESRTVQVGLDMLRQVGTVEVNPYGRRMNEDELLAEARDADAILLGTDPLTRKVIESCQKLKVVARHGAGFDNVDLAAATEKGVFVTNAPNAPNESVADFTIGLMISLARLIPRASASMAERKWEKNVLAGTDVCQKTLGIVGLGRIGAAVCKRAAGFDMTTLATDPLISKEQAKQRGAELVPLESLLRRSDFVSIHVPLNQETKRLIGGKELAMMKQTSYIINTSRGGIIDVDALYHALLEKKIAGAAIDVFDQEPPAQDYPLYGLPNVILTPHIAGVSHESLERVAVTAAEAITAALQGRVPQNVVNIDVLSKAPQNVTEDH